MSFHVAVVIIPWKHCKEEVPHVSTTFTRRTKSLEPQHFVSFLSRNSARQYDGLKCEG